MRLQNVSIEAIHEFLAQKPRRRHWGDGIVKALPKPCILLVAKLALKKQQELVASQLRFKNCPAPAPELRAVNVSVNRAAREEGILMHPRWRVPK